MIPILRRRNDVVTAPTLRLASRLAPPPSVAGTRFMPRRVVFHPRGRYVAATCDGTLRVWDLDECRIAWERKEVTDCAVVPESGELLVVGWFDASLVSFERGEPIRTILDEAEDELTAGVVTSDGAEIILWDVARGPTRYATSSGAELGAAEADTTDDDDRLDDDEPPLARARSSENLVFTLHRSGIAVVADVVLSYHAFSYGDAKPTGIVISPHDQLVTWLDDGSCLTWRIEPAPRDFGAGDPEWKYDHAVVDEATPGRMIVSGYGLPAHVWEAARGSVVGPVYMRADEEGQAARPLHGAVLRAGPSSMAVVDGESMSLIKRASGHVVGSVHAHGFDGGAFLRSVARGGARLLHAAPSSNRAFVHDPTNASQHALAELSVEGTGGITALAFADEAGSLVLLGCADGTLRRYRIPDAAGRDGRPLPVAGVTLASVGAVRSLACMEHQGVRLALVGDTTGKVQCVDVERAAVVRTLDAGADAVVEIVPSLDGSRFCTRTGGGSIRLWDVGGTCTGACVEPTARALVLGAEVVGMIDALGQLVVLEPSSVPSPAQNT